MSSVLYHNPRCSKSRDALKLLEGKKITVKEYLKEGLSQAEVKNLVKALGQPIDDILRSKEDIYKKLNVKEMSVSEKIKALAANPILLERPILLKGAKAVIGRPPENVLKI